MNETGLDYSAFLMELPEPVIAIDSRGLIIGCNSATSTKFDYTREELRGQNIRMLIPEPWVDGSSTASPKAWTARSVWTLSATGWTGTTLRI